MTTYRVPVDLLAPLPSPPFAHVRDYWDSMFDALGIYARISVTTTTDGGAVVRPVTDDRHNFYVVLTDRGPTPDSFETPEAAAAAVVDRALRQIGLDSTRAAVDVDAVQALEDPNGD